MKLTSLYSMAKLYIVRIDSLRYGSEETALLKVGDRVYEGNETLVSLRNGVASQVYGVSLKGTDSLRILDAGRAIVG